MTSITLSWFGPPEQKHVVKVTAMQTLTDVLQAASSKFKPALQPDQCELQLSKKPVDLRTPFRLLNVPAGSKLEIVKKSAPSAGAASATAQAPANASPAVPPPAAAAAISPSPAPQEAAAPKAQDPEAEAAASASQAAAATAPVAAAPAAVAAPRQVSFVASDATVTPAAAALAGVAPSQAASSQAAAAGPGGAVPSSTAAAAAAQPSSSVDPALAALGVTAPVYVFHQRALEAAASQAPSAMELDPPDDFFVLTPEDLQRLHAQAAAKRKAESTFRTRTAREAESAARAASMGPVRVRLHLPDGTLLQSHFKATDPLSQVQDLLRKVAVPDLAPGLYLYTTPPKTLLKDASASLYSLQLVPAAHIHVGLDEKKAPAAALAGGSWLRPEVQSLMQETVPDQQQAADPEQRQDTAGSSSSSAEAAAAAQRAARLAAAASRQQSTGAAAGGGKVPKWFKK